MSWSDGSVSDEDDYAVNGASRGGFQDERQAWEPNDTYYDLESGTQVGDGGASDTEWDYGGGSSGDSGTTRYYGTLPPMPLPQSPPMPPPHLERAPVSPQPPPQPPPQPQPVYVQPAVPTHGPGPRAQYTPEARRSASHGAGTGAAPERRSARAPVPPPPPPPRVPPNIPNPPTAVFIAIRRAPTDDEVEPGRCASLSWFGNAAPRYVTGSEMFHIDLVFRMRDKKRISFEVSNQHAHVMCYVDRPYPHDRWQVCAITHDPLKSWRMYDSAMKKEKDSFNQRGYMFNFIPGLRRLFGTSGHSNTWFCSQFVATVMAEGDPECFDGLAERAHSMRPQDVLDAFRKQFGGHAGDALDHDAPLQITTTGDLLL